MKKETILPVRKILLNTSSFLVIKFMADRSCALKVLMTSGMGDSLPFLAPIPSPCSEPRPLGHGCLDVPQACHPTFNMSSTELWSYSSFQLRLVLLNIFPVVDISTIKEPVTEARHSRVFLDRSVY